MLPATHSIEGNQFRATARRLGIRIGDEPEQTRLLFFFSVASVTFSISARLLPLGREPGYTNRAGWLKLGVYLS